MKTYLAATVLAVALAQPAGAVTFPSLTTIYVGSGVFDDGGADDTGSATSIHCSNVSGASVQVRVLILGETGAVEGALTESLAHGATQTFSTHQTNIFADVDNDLATGSVGQGVVNVETTNSAVFCTALTVNASLSNLVEGVPLRLVRVNPHPGTVE